jgi:hypothetical protein
MTQGGKMRTPRIVVIGLVLVFSLGLFTAFAQDARRQDAKQPQREVIPKEIKAIIQEGLATRQGRQDIPFTIFKYLAFPVKGGMHTVLFFKAKNADLGYAAPVPAAGQAKQDAQAQPAAPAAGGLEARLGLALEFLQADETGALKVARDSSFPVIFQTDGAGYDPAKEEWYALGFGLPCGKYTVAMLLAPLDAKKGTVDPKRVGVSYYDINLPGPETYQGIMETTPIFFAKSIEQMQDYERRPVVHRGLFTYSVLQIVPNIDSVVTAEDKSQIEVFFFILGAKAKEEAQAPPTVQPPQEKYEIEVNYEVQGTDGVAVIKWQAQNYVSPLIDQVLPLKQTKKIMDEKGVELRQEVKDLAAGKYTLVIKIADKISGFAAERKLPFEVK